MTASARKPTLEDVARTAGVSRALVSIVMREAPGASEQTRARVKAVAGEIGYRPDARARLLARGTARLLGVVYRVDALHHVDLLAPIYDTAEAAGYELILSGRTRRHDEQHAVNTLLDYRCDALVMLGPDLTQAEITRLARTVPVILAGRRLVRPSPNVGCVRTDERAGTQLAIEHLVRLGHRRIAHISGGENTISLDRRAGYLAAAEALGIENPLLVIEGDGLGAGGEAGGAVLARFEPRPTAVVAFNDETAWGVVRALAREGLRVPEDVSVVGYDGSSLAQLAPMDLTTVRQDTESIARFSVLRAIERLEQSERAPTDEMYAPALVLGQTTGPVPTP